MHWIQSLATTCTTLASITLAGALRSTPSSSSSGSRASYPAALLDGLQLHRVVVPLASSRASSSGIYCYTVANATQLPPPSNFLATQVWPSARVAAQLITQLSCRHTICEFGCGPGLPSLMAAAHGHIVTATDMDELARQLVQTAAREQDLPVGTRHFDLLAAVPPSPPSMPPSLTDDAVMILPPQADLYLMSDVFESAAVARGAAAWTAWILQQYRGNAGSLRPPPPTVWVVCQSDRAQRDVFLQQIRHLLDNDDIQWQPHHSFSADIRLKNVRGNSGSAARLHLIEVQEELVAY